MSVDPLVVLGSVVLGVSLAATTGLRAFLPLFLLGLVARFTDLVDLGEAFEWVSSGPALLAFGTGVALELAADKVPGLNHLLDALQTPVRTGAGILISASVMVDLPMWSVAILAIIVGGGTALAVHVAKSGLRLGASAATGGTASPVASVLEDILCAAGALLSMFIFVFSLVIAAVGVVVFVVSAKTVYRRITR